MGIKTHLVKEYSMGKGPETKCGIILYWEQQTKLALGQAKPTCLKCARTKANEELEREGTRTPSPRKPALQGNRTPTLQHPLQDEV